MAGEVGVYGAGGFAAFGDGPDDEGLAAAHVAGGEDAWFGGLVVGGGFDVSAGVEFEAELGEVALIPAQGGVFEVRLDGRRCSDQLARGDSAWQSRLSGGPLATP